MSRNNIMGSTGKDPPLIPPILEEEDEDESGQGADVAVSTVNSAVRWRGKSKKKKLKMHRPYKLKHFERRYTELGPMLKPEQKRVDYVLVYPNKSSKDTSDESKRKSLEDKEVKRELFENAMRKEGFDLMKEPIGDNMFVKLHCPFKRLCMEAEKVKLEMRLKGCPNFESDIDNFFTRMIDKYFETDVEVDFISAPFLMDRIQLYEDFEDPTNFFRPSQRSLLVDHILINIDIRKEADKRKKKEKKESEGTEDTEAGLPEEKDNSCLKKYCFCCYGHSKTDVKSETQLQKWELNSFDDEEEESDEEDEVTQEPVRQPGQRHGLPYLRMKDVYTDAFILHEDSVKCNEKEELRQQFFTEEEKTNDDRDPRKDLDETWTKFYKFQPVWKIRNYFGEKIALYFAWTGMLTTSLWIPTLFGLGIFLYGLAISIDRSGQQTTTLPVNATALETIKYEMANMYDVIKSAFDNDVTPFFALIVCLWGTVFLEFWKRKSSTLSYEWDVDNYDANEPDRPQFFGTKLKKDPITLEFNWFYSVKRQFLKYCCSTSALMFMVLLVFASLIAVIVYRVIMSVDVCPSMSAVECLIVSNIISAVLNAASILLLGKIYDKVAVVLTEWENHRTQSAYDDALIIKLFAFQFANSYASCVYIAFFRGTLEFFNLGAEYQDECHGTCMSQLSFQVLVLMIAKPFPKVFKDILLPLIKKLWRKRPKWLCRCKCCCKFCHNRVDTENPKDDIDADKIITKSYIEIEYQKPPLEDFTLSEYTEKIIQYGFLMLFAASFPLAPLLALLTNLFDIRVDAKRMLWWYRRPIAYIRKDIGRWYGILDFVNLVGVISNGFLIAFTSSWGQQFEYSTKLWIVIGFEHLVFALKFVLAYLIPDVPREIRLAIRREKFQVARILELARGTDPTDYATLVPEPKKRRKTRSSNYDTFEDDANTIEKFSKSMPKPANETAAKPPIPESAIERFRQTLEKAPANPPNMHVDPSKESSPPFKSSVSLDEDKISLDQTFDAHNESLKSKGDMWYCNDSKTSEQEKLEFSTGFVSLSGVDTHKGINSSQETLQTPRPVVIKGNNQSTV